MGSLACIKKVFITLSVILCIAMVSTSMAAEDGALNYIPGAPGSVLGEFPPIPGLFVIAQTSYTSSDALYDHHGDEIKDLDFNLDAWAQTFRFLASYPHKVWGANIYSQLVVPMVSVDTSASVDTHSPAGVVSLFDEDDRGLGNLTISPIILNWQQAESHQYFTAGLDIALEKGASYTKDKHVNAGTGYSTIMPVLAWRYDDPDGLDFGVKANVMFNMENDYTHYDTGDMLSLEFIGGWNLGKMKVGLIGAYTLQYEDDESNGSEVADSKMKSLVIGPSIAYSMGPLIINLNYQKGILAENGPMTDTLWLNIALPLYVPPSARPK
ncbi:MAG: transporter [Proteobacteria bacterium]|nr:transporter [Pseudomonadota bacterium]